MAQESEPRKRKKKKKRSIEPEGIAHIKATFNNTHINQGMLLLGRQLEPADLKDQGKARLMRQLWQQKKWQKKP